MFREPTFLERKDGDVWCTEKLLGRWSQGEGIFLPLKKSINRGLHAKGVCKQVLLSQYQTLAMNQLVDFQTQIDDYTSFIEEELGSNSNDRDIIDDEEEVPVIALDTKRYRKYYCYESMHHVNQQLEEYKPISIAWFVSDKKLFVFIGRKNRKKSRGKNGQILLQTVLLFCTERIIICIGWTK